MQVLGPRLCPRGLGVLIWRLFEEPDLRSSLPRVAARSLAIVLVMGGLVVWASYGFTIGTIADLSDLRGVPGPFGVLARLDPKIPLPAPAFFDGVGQLLEIDRNGMNREHGGWSWLRGHPFRPVGKSIRLFHIP
jgi:hypothetical protein